MSRNLLAMLTTAALVIALPVNAEEDPNLLLIKARKGEMQVRAMAVTPLFAMAKGKIPYDAAQAQALAGNLKTLMALEMGSAWPAGTSKAEYPDKTHALPEVWSTWPKIAESGKEYGMAVEELVKVAGNGLEALRGVIGDVGQGCKGCHDDFREKE